ncbi:MAG: hypothetical protein JST65_16185 [Acidobacteria bacterium]|nr:hypothetical protein [Acidobacteriota bacterium]
MSYAWNMKTDEDGDPIIIVMDANDREVMWIGVGEVIGDCDPAFVLETLREHGHV